MAQSALRDDPVVSFPRRKAKAAPDELAALLTSLDIKIIGPNDYRHQNCTTAVETLRSLLAKHGAEHLTIVLRAIVESAGNARALIDPVIRAMSAVVLAHPEYVAKGLEFVEAFDDFPLLDCYRGTAALRKTAPAPAWAALAGMIVLVLRDGFDRDRKRHRTRAEIAADREEREEAERARVAAAKVSRNRRKIETGLQLIELKRKAGRGQFLRLAQQRFGLAYPGEVAALVRVAALYGEREPIWSRVSWQVLGVLAAPAMPSDLRTEYEARIEAGEHITAKEVAPPPIGRPRSRP
ncbi:hypothetical protein BJ122_105112 [Rhodopseudomonas faecalis]|uniref:Uncharacterized protein n=1 Tax=Rhodopseudomonas faecalis TaxID=99655 RepID=A0A318TPL5_9BRAD|nr:hypothetical protein [Rhodopseudomonas faecalis]PYF03855.1 hypothetical protein BJ122_105112 [Rhodopseudomonas faecalis]